MSNSYFCYNPTGCGNQEQFYGCADVAIGNSDVTVGATSSDVQVPAGDFDERQWPTFKDPCTCALTSAASDVAYSVFCHVIVLFSAVLGYDRFNI